MDRRAVFNDGGRYCFATAKQIQPLARRCGKYRPIEMIRGFSASPAPYIPAMKEPQP